METYNYTAHRVKKSDEQRLLAELMFNYEKEVRPVLKATSSVSLSNPCRYVHTPTDFFLLSYILTPCQSSHFTCSFYIIQTLDAVTLETTFNCYIISQPQTAQNTQFIN